MRKTALKPADATAMLRRCGPSGRNQIVQHYRQASRIGTDGELVLLASLRDVRAPDVLIASESLRPALAVPSGREYKRIRLDTQRVEGNQAARLRETAHQEALALKSANAWKREWFRVKSA